MNKYVLLLMGSMVINTFSMERADEESDDEDEEREKALVKKFSSFPYGSDIPSSPNYNPDLYKKIIEDKLSEPVNVAAVTAKKQEPNPKTDKKS